MLRYFHSTSFYNSVNKSALAKLRKKTGYTFANCRKALELNENDLGKAEEWLREQAKTLGWAKATKLEGRPTSQGLVGVAFAPEKAVMVEVNCETDFVARNSKFKSLVELVTSTCLTQNLTSQHLNAEDLKNLKTSDGSPLADHQALLIGDIGENVALRRAFSYTTTPGLKLAGYTHPAPEQSSSILLGKYGALIAFTAPDNPEAKDLGRQLCQHVIGMNPRAVGQIGVDEAAECIDEETTMVHQEYLLDPLLTVGQLLSDLQASVVSFKRFECGEPDEVVEESVEKEPARAEG